MEQQSQVVGFKETGANIGLKLPQGIWKHWPQADRHKAGPLCFQGAPRICGAGNDLTCTWPTRGVAQDPQWVFGRRKSELLTWGLILVKSAIMHER